MTPRLTPLKCLLIGLSLMALSGALVWLEGGTRYEESQRRRLNLQISSSSGGSSFTFKILQLADLHFGENSWTDWGPQQDVDTFRVLKSVITAEKPDLIVLSGDQLTANNIDENATAVYRNLCQHLARYEIPWAMIFGNHDDAPLETSSGEDDSVLVTPAKTSREDLYHVDRSFAPLSLTRLGPKLLFGTSNYILEVYRPGGKNEVAMELLFLDTGGGSLPKRLETNQVQWFQQHRKRDKSIPMIAFQHIPTKEFAYDGDRCVGLQDDPVDSIEEDPKIIDALMEDGNVQFLAVGHNHGNDYCCSYKDNMHLCFGRHSGYGGYGSWDRGSRVYEIQMNKWEEEEVSNQRPALQWKSWVRMESGDVEDEYSPFDDGHDDKN